MKPASIASEMHLIPWVIFACKKKMQAKNPGTYAARLACIFLECFRRTA